MLIVKDRFLPDTIFSYKKTRYEAGFIAIIYFTLNCSGCCLHRYRKRRNNITALLC